MGGSYHWSFRLNENITYVVTVYTTDSVGAATVTVVGRHAGGGNACAVIFFFSSLSNVLSTRCTRLLLPRCGKFFCPRRGFDAPFLALSIEFKRTSLAFTLDNQSHWIKDSSCVTLHARRLPALIFFFYFLFLLFPLLLFFFTFAHFRSILPFGRYKWNAKETIDTKKPLCFNNDAIFERNL